MNFKEQINNFLDSKIDDQIFNSLTLREAVNLINKKVPKASYNTCLTNLNLWRRKNRPKIEKKKHDNFKKISFSVGDRITFLSTKDIRLYNVYTKVGRIKEGIILKRINNYYLIQVQQTGKNMYKECVFLSEIIKKEN